MMMIMIVMMILIVLYINDNSNNNMTCIVSNQFLVTSLYFPFSLCKFRELGGGWRNGLSF